MSFFRFFSSLASPVQSSLLFLWGGLVLVGCLPENIGDPLLKMSFRQMAYYDVTQTESGEISNATQVRVDFFGPSCPADPSCVGQGSCTRCFPIEGNPIGKEMSLVLGKEAFPLENGLLVLSGRVDILAQDESILAAGWLETSDVVPSGLVPVVNADVHLSFTCVTEQDCRLSSDDEPVAAFCSFLCEDSDVDGGTSCSQSGGVCDTRPSCPVAAQCATSNPRRDEDNIWNCGYEVDHDICNDEEDGTYCNPRIGCEVGVGCYPSDDEEGENGRCGEVLYTCFEQICSAEYKCKDSDQLRISDCKRCENGKFGDDMPELTNFENGSSCGATSETVCIEGECVTSVCGDGVRFGEELCDDGEDNSDAPDVDNSRPCRTNCLGTARIGDGITDPSEECDDGNDSNLDFCRNDGTINICGDGFRNILEGGEECDDGNQSNSDGCLSLCPQAQQTNCLPTERICKTNLPNDGFQNRNLVDGFFVEICDDGNQNENDGCHNGLRQYWGVDVVSGANSGDGGSQELIFGSFPVALATDEVGNLIIGNPAEGRVVRLHTSEAPTVRPDGEASRNTYRISFVAGDGAFGSAKPNVENATNASFISPISVAVNGLGVVYVVDRESNRLYGVDQGRKIENVAGVYGEEDLDSIINDDPFPLPANFIPLGKPIDVAVDGLGTVYLAEQGAGRIRRIDPLTKAVVDIANAASGLLRYRIPQELEDGLAPSDTRYVDEEFVLLSNVALTKAGDLLLSDHKKEAGVFRIFLVETPSEEAQESEAIPLYSRNGNVVTAVGFKQPYDVVTDDDGLYVVACEEQKLTYFKFVNPQGSTGFQRAEILAGVDILPAGDGGMGAACATTGFRGASAVEPVEDLTTPLRLPFFMAVYNEHLYISELGGRIRHLVVDENREVLLNESIAGVFGSTQVQYDPLQLKIIRSFPNAAALYQPPSTTTINLRPTRAFIALSASEDNAVVEVSQGATLYDAVRSPSTDEPPNDDPLLDPRALAYDEASNFWVADRGHSRVVFFERNEVCRDGFLAAEGEAYSKFDLVPTNQLVDLVVDRNVFIPGPALNAPEGIAFEAGSDCSDDTDCESGVCRDTLCVVENDIDPCGRSSNRVTHKKKDRIYIADTGNHRILMVQPWADAPRSAVVVAGDVNGTSGTFVGDFNPLEMAPATDWRFNRPVGVVALRQRDFAEGLPGGNQRVLVVVDRGNHAVEILREVTGGAFAVFQLIGRPGEEGYFDVAENGDLESARFSYPRGISLDRSTGNIIIVDGQDRLRSLALSVDGFNIQAVVDTVSQGSFKPDDGVLENASLGAPQQMSAIPGTNKRSYLVADGVKGRIRLLQIPDEECTQEALVLCQECSTDGLTTQECEQERGLYCNAKPAARIDTAIGVPRGEGSLFVGESPASTVFARAFNINGQATGVVLDPETGNIFISRKGMRQVDSERQRAAVGIFRITPNGFSRGPLVNETNPNLLGCEFQVCPAGTSWHDDTESCEAWLVEEMNIQIEDRRGQTLELLAPGALEIAQVNDKTLLLIPDEKLHAVFAISTAETTLENEDVVFAGFPLVGTPNVRGRISETVFPDDDEEDAGTSESDAGITLPNFSDSILFQPSAVRFQAEREWDSAATCENDDVTTNSSLYISDTGNHQLLRADLKTGALYVVAGNGAPATTAGGTPTNAFPLHSPRGLELDDDGNVYVAAFGSLHILSPEGCEGDVAQGKMTTIYGTPPRLSYPESATDCVSTLAATDEQVYFMDACQGLLLRAAKSDVARTQTDSP